MDQAPASTRVFLERPAPAYVCGARYSGCVSVPGYSWTCETEGAEIKMCTQCIGQWRIRAQNIPQLRQRCPRCADLAVCADAAGEVSAAPALPSRLSGAAALAIDHALHMEGVLPDVRERVLKRLSAEAAWLEAVRG